MTKGAFGGKRKHNRVPFLKKTLKLRKEFLERQNILDAAEVKKHEVK